MDLFSFTFIHIVVVAVAAVAAIAAIATIVAVIVAVVVDIKITDKKFLLPVMVYLKTCSFDRVNSSFQSNLLKCSLLLFFLPLCLFFKLPYCRFQDLTEIYNVFIKKNKQMSLI
ncbi:hypothetical protein F8M41_012103 [Gigaspora margarita]|uniref:Uncharacterized protein n=1 Tax=Gigaspora margarita TaxID=4874 RepID=A0A8H3ZZU3_GIGMA|nr:hypothetical protein F8M41_012103 [Gigaspora margarita]